MEARRTGHEESVEEDASLGVPNFHQRRHCHRMARPKLRWLFVRAMGFGKRRYRRVYPRIERTVMMPSFYKFSATFHHIVFVVMVFCMVLNGALNAGRRDLTNEMLSKQYLSMPLSQLTNIRVVG